MDFDNELQKAIQRGQQLSQSRNAAAKQEALTAEEIRTSHTAFRLHLSDHIENCLKRLANHFPGFEYETIYGSRGWGGAVSRNDLTRGPDGKSGSFFSRIELTVRPQNEFNVVNIAGKGTIRDKEMFSWNHFDDVHGCDKTEFEKRIDAWVLQYAEQFAAR
ncbi:hypothetical protein N9L06_01185 [Mariniblastus sp.]|nr:hypothetical protein [Mariniblastus sp.]